MTIFHKFYIQNITFMSEIEKLLYAIVCLFIGSKICNELLPLEKIIQEYLLCIMKKSEITKEAIIETTQKVCSVEFEVLAKIGFDLNIDLPYKYLDLMVNYVMKTLRNRKFIEISCNYVNDSFKFPLCLYYSPKLIALASIYMTIQLFKSNLPDTSDGLKWYQIVDPRIDFDKIVEVANFLEKIYKFYSQKNEKQPFLIKNMYGHNLKVSQSYCEKSFGKNIEDCKDNLVVLNDTDIIKNVCLNANEEINGVFNNKLNKELTQKFKFQKITNNTDLEIDKFLRNNI